MGNFIEMDYSALQGVADAYRRAPEIAREELGAAMAEADALLATQVEAFTPVASGALAGSETHVEKINETSVIGMVFSPLNYVSPVELGTRPHFPPVNALIDWVIQKLGVPEKDARNVAFLVARKISRTGTRGQHQHERALDVQGGAVEAIFARAVVRIGARLQGAPG